MKFVREEVNPTSYVERGILDVDDAGVRDNINVLLTGALSSCTLTPYIALEKVRKVLAYFHIHLDKAPFMEGDRGVQVFDVHQFGRSVGMRNDGEVVTKVPQPYSIYFEYQQNEKGMFDIFCEIVTQDELDDLIDDAEEDINDDDTVDDRDERLQVKESQMQETSHESVNHVRRLAMKKKINETDTMWNTALNTAKELSGYNNISNLYQDIQKGNIDGALQTAGKAVIGATPIMKSMQIAQTLNPIKTSPEELDQIKTAGIANARRLAPAGARPALERGIQQQNSQMQETSHESVNHVRRLAMKNKRNDI